MPIHIITPGLQRSEAEAAKGIFFRFKSINNGKKMNRTFCTDMIRQGLEKGGKVLEQDQLPSSV